METMESQLRAAAGRPTALSSSTPRGTSYRESLILPGNCSSFGTRGSWATRAEKVSVTQRPPHKRLPVRAALAVRVLPVLLAVAASVCSCSDNSQLARVTAAAKRGDAQAQFQLGEYYYDRVELPPDYAAASLWFRRAAQQGHPAAQYALGKMLLNGQGALPDELEGAQWIRKAAQQGYAPAQNELGMMHSEGSGVMQDLTEAKTWFTKAAEQGLAESQYHLGALLAAGAPDGAATSKLTACFWLSLAAAQGDAESQDLLQTLTPQLNSSQLEELKRRTAQWQKKQAATHEKEK